MQKDLVSRTRHHSAAINVKAIAQRVFSQDGPILSHRHLVTDLRCHHVRESDQYARKCQEEETSGVQHYVIKGIGRFFYRCVLRK